MSQFKTLNIEGNGMVPNGDYVRKEDYDSLQRENESNLKSAQYSAETNRKVVRTNEVLSDKVFALQQKLDAVLAENARMLSDYREIPEMRRIGAPLTPATDAILNEVRAEGGPSIQAADLKSLLRFNETSEDGEGYDIDGEAMKRLIELGLVAKERAGMRVITSFGMWVIAREHGEAVAMLETQRDRDLAFQRKISQLRAGSTEGGV